MLAVRGSAGRSVLVLAVVVAFALIPASVAVAVPEGPAPGTPDWYVREAQNYALDHSEQTRELADPNFQLRLNDQSTANLLAYNQRQVADPDWSAFGNVCQTWQGDCAGDPYRYPGVDSFYASVGKRQTISYYDDGGARIEGMVWPPQAPPPAGGYPGVVIETGSVQAPQPLYWWFAETLVRAGYVVMTFDVRGQGHSDTMTPSGQQGSNANSTVFWDGLVDAIDWFRTTPGQTYPYNAQWQGSHPLWHAGENNDFNPYWTLLDHSRLGIAGHSLGATGVSIVQGYNPWPGKIGHGGPNPVDVAVAWDNLSAGSSSFGGPPAAPRVPSLGSSNDYDLTPHPYTSPPDPESKKAAFHAWEKAGVPTYQLVIQGGSHFEYSLIPSTPAPGFPATNWFTWGNPFANHYSLAWIDRWLKHAGEPGYADADQRLLDDKSWGDRMSFYMRSARNYPDRGGRPHVCQDIRAGCTDTATPYTPPPYVPSSASGGGPLALPNTGANPFGMAFFVAAAAAALLRLALGGRRQGAAVRN